MDVEVAGSAHSRTRSNKASDRPTKGSMCNTPRSPILKLRIISHKKFKKKSEQLGMGMGRHAHGRQGSSTA